MTPVQQKLLNKNQKMACLFFIIFLSIHSTFPIIFKKPVISASFPHLLIVLGNDPGPPVAEHAQLFHCIPALHKSFLTENLFYPKQQYTELQFKKLPYFLLSSKFVIKNKPRKLIMVIGRQRFRIQCHLWLHSKFQASLGYRDPDSKNQKTSPLPNTHTPKQKKKTQPH